MILKVTIDEQTYDIDVPEQIMQEAQDYPLCIRVLVVVIVKHFGLHI